MEARGSEDLSGGGRLARPGLTDVALASRLFRPSVEVANADPRVCPAALSVPTACGEREASPNQSAPVSAGLRQRQTMVAQ